MTNRAARLFIARLLIGFLVLAQGATVAHACSGLGAASGGSAAASAGMQRPVPAGATARSDDRRVELSNPAVCSMHCQIAQRSVDPVHVAAAPAPMWLGSYPLPGRDSTRATRPAAVDDRAATVDPPHAILHCCLRV